ncbi:hypothetical protein SCHPADRAFT_665302 [Schizopora paradoxa]|uniref:Uncharacterized protein n=1 Tax=Schizopora paradoxa TaxID=27342 RepID=A0A0H2RC67_9AGAM|nr:hypothetical protein SCHPADRAFT_665302 [Schizopora paradoxa]
MSGDALQTASSSSVSGYSSRPTREDAEENDPTSTSLIAKPRRTLGSSMSKVGSGFRSIVTKTVPDRFLSPADIANEIRRVRKHHETTIFQRHREGSDGSPDADKETLKALCMRLLICCERSDLFGFRNVALYEFTMLGINDPHVRILFQQCVIEVNRTREHDDALFPEPPQFSDQHALWSDLLGGRVFEAADEKELNKYSALLKVSLSMGPGSSLKFRSTGYLGFAYLSHALLMDVKDRKLKFLMGLWEHLLKVLATDARHGGWEVLDASIRNILSSEKRMYDFLRPSHFVGDLAVYLIWNADKIPTLYRIFFSPLQVQYTPENKDQDQLNISYPPMEHWSIPVIVAYAVTVTYSLVSSPQSKEVRSLEDLRRYARRAQTGTTLADSVLCDEKWMTFYTVLHYAISCYHSNHGISLAEGIPRPVRDSLCILASWCAELRNQESNRALVHLISQLINVNRYFKEALVEDYDSTLPLILFRLPSKENREGCLQKYTCITLFENVPYLRRYRINGKYFITSRLQRWPPMSTKRLRYSSSGLYTVLVGR